MPACILFEKLYNGGLRARSKALTRAGGSPRNTDGSGVFQVQGPTLLCIDDEPSGLQLRKILLERNGYTVITALSGHQGLELFAASDVDLVILDYYMPGMHGDEVAAAMKKRRPRVPIIMLSAFVFVRQQALAFVDTYLVKGESPALLLGAITRLLKDNRTTPVSG